MAKAVGSTPVQNAAKQTKWEIIKGEEDSHLTPRLGSKDFGAADKAVVITFFLSILQLESNGLANFNSHRLFPHFGW